ncbi:MAG: hypothetical protein M1814_002161 [Vezdaea aestivalis]|nr:MAG: hypothetical protein M1814_002161 [Vezdaea aestivalis]
MPALADYTPLESLILFQSLERYGTEPEAFQKTSAILLHNEYVAEASGADRRRLSAEALKEVYDFLLDQELNTRENNGNSNRSNGLSEAHATSNGSSSPRKRKLGSRSPTPSATLMNSPHMLPRLVTRLYSRYRDSVILELRRDEQRINTLQRDLRQLEVDNGPTSELSYSQQRQENHLSRDVKSKEGEEKAEFRNGPASYGDTSSSTSAVQEPSLATSSAQQAQVALDSSARRYASSALGHPSQATTQALSGLTSQQRTNDALGQSNITQDVAPVPMAAPIIPKVGPLLRNEHAKSAGYLQQNSLLDSNMLFEGSKHERASENLSASQTYNSPFQVEEAAVGNQPSQANKSDKPITSLPPHIRPDSVQSPSSLFLHNGMESPRTPVMPMSGHSSILGNRRPTLTVSTSSTKWKTSPPHFLDSARGSPEPDEVSPISDKAPSPTPFVLSNNNKVTGIPTGSQSSQFGYNRGTGRRRGSIPSQPKALNRGRRKIRGESISSAAALSSKGSTRSRSAVSFADEGAADLDTVPNRKVKREEAATPRFSIDEDTEMDDESAIDDSVHTNSRPTQRTARGSTFSFDDARKDSKSERLIGIIHRKSESVSLMRDIPDPSLVSTTKNFSRTTAPIMQTITGHRLASLFANPVKEKDAPGYSSMIYRPQDLKSIKAAITAGGRAVNALQGSSKDNVDSPVQGSSTPQKNKEVMVPVTPDLVPPKAIVNSAQLEKEVMRMFANAVMFNQDPSRGFGPTFGDQEQLGDNDGEGPQSHYAEIDGGVVTDTREMFEAVQGQLSTWRGSLKSRIGTTDRHRTASEVGEEEPEYFLGTGEGESLAEDGGPSAVKRRKRA